MFCAFWLDPSATDPNKRVVICQPFAKKPATAWAVLRSAVREKRTGGIIAGPEEKLRGCVEAIEQKDQKWPDNPDRMVAQITKLASTQECTVIFRQNIEPNDVAAQSSVWSSLWAGQTSIDREDANSQTRTPLTGSSETIDAAFEAAHNNGWLLDSTGAVVRFANGAVITLARMSPTRAALTVEHVTATTTQKKNSAGFSQEFKLSFERLDDLLDAMLGPTAKRYKFALLIKERQNSILFFGTKRADTTRHAIEQYVAHLLDQQSSDEPMSSQPDDSQTSLLEDKLRPSIQNCRFWKLRPVIS